MDSNVVVGALSTTQICFELLEDTFVLEKYSFWVFEDIKFKISEGYDQNWCFPDSAQVAVSV